MKMLLLEVVLGRLLHQQKKCNLIMAVLCFRPLNVEQLQGQGKVLKYTFKIYPILQKTD